MFSSLSLKTRWRIAVPVLFEAQHEVHRSSLRNLLRAPSICPFVIFLPRIFLFLYLVIHFRDLLDETPRLGRAYPEEAELVLHAEGVEHLFQGRYLPAGEIIAFDEMAVSRVASGHEDPVRPFEDGLDAQRPDRPCSNRAPGRASPRRDTSSSGSPPSPTP